MRQYITVCVITYNSSKYVIDALNSVSQQTYPYIDLIISDDKSQDNTVELCRKWISKNKERFRKCHLVETEVNTGTAGNLNRGISLCETEWIKCMAGDDALYPQFLFQFMAHYADSTYNIVTTDSGVYNEILSMDYFSYYSVPNSLFFKVKSAKEQYNILLRRNLLGASFMYKTSLLKQVGGFDERYPLFEDKPILLKITMMGNIIGYAPILSTKYRISETSVQKSTNKVFSKYSMDTYRFYKEVLIPQLDFIGRNILKIRQKRLDYYNNINNGVLAGSNTHLFRLETKIFSIVWKIVEFFYYRKGGMKMIQEKNYHKICK